MSSKVQALYTLMQSGSKVSLDKMMTTLNIKQGSVMCLISALRNDFGAQIETERDGRKVLSYQMTNADKVVITSKNTTKAPKVAKTPKVKSTKTKTVVSRKAAKDDEFDVPTLDADLDITEVSDAELADLRNQLGLA
jgi:biotin operon repressor